MQSKTIEISAWAQEVIKDMKAQLGGQIRFTESDAIDGALFLMCILPADSYVSIENYLIEVSKEGNVLLSIEEEMRALQTFKSMYSLDQSGRRRKFYGLMDKESEALGEVL